MDEGDDVGNGSRAEEFETKAAAQSEELARDDMADEEISADIDAAVGDGRDVVSLVEMIAAQAGGIDDLRIKRLFDLITKGALDRDIYEAVVQGTLYFVDEEPDGGRLDEELRLRFKCNLQAFSSGAALVEATRNKLPDVVLLGARASELDAAGVLPELLVAAFGREVVPVVLFSDDESWQTAFEVLTYPRLAFVRRDRGADGLLDALAQYVAVDRTEAAIVPDDALKEQIGLTKAQAIQKKLLPEEIPSVPGLEIAAYYSSCQEVGGDYYDFFPRADGRLGVLCADVSGKGVGAAMVMVMFRAIVRLAAHRYGTPRDVILATNNQISKDMLQGMFVSALYLVVDPKTGSLELVNAGHMPLVHWPAGQPRPVEVPVRGMVVGLATGDRFKETLSQGQLEVEPGELLCLYTDGVVEAENAAREQYGLDRLFDAICDGGHGVSPQEAVDHVMADVQAFVGDVPQHDDTTLIILKAT